MFLRIVGQLLASHPVRSSEIWNTVAVGVSSGVCAHVQVSVDGHSPAPGRYASHWKGVISPEQPAALAWRATVASVKHLACRRKGNIVVDREPTVSTTVLARVPWS